MNLKFFEWHDDDRGGSYVFFGPFQIWVIPMSKTDKKGNTRYVADVIVPESKFAIRYTAMRCLECYASNLDTAKKHVEQWLKC